MAIERLIEIRLLADGRFDVVVSNPAIGLHISSTLVSAFPLELLARCDREWAGLEWRVRVGLHPSHPSRKVLPTLSEIRAAYEQGQRDAEQGWRLGPEAWGWIDRERGASYWLGFAAPRRLTGGKYNAWINNAPRDRAGHVYPFGLARARGGRPFVFASAAAVEVWLTANGFEVSTDATIRRSGYPCEALNADGPTAPARWEAFS